MLPLFNPLQDTLVAAIDTMLGALGVIIFFKIDAVQLFKSTTVHE